MASLVGSNIRPEKNKVEVKLSMNYSEYMLLQGHATNIRIFSENTPCEKTRVRTTGKRGETKYLLVPRDIRNQIRFNSNVDCQYRIIGDKVILFFVIDK
ncbi:hypothetical protein KY358_04255 [Candidatus Woesearchaeota archaeon]|nr:hypothetical protein [Candidatus Woesearchaeota archaeon]